MVLEFGERYVRFHTQGRTVLGDNGQAYEIETPYIEADLFDIHYVQSADVMTLVHPNYPPKELRRYGATDWRLVDIKFGSSLSAPTGLSAEQTINKDVTNPTDYKRTYAVTALLSDGTRNQFAQNPLLSIAIRMVTVLITRLSGIRYKVLACIVFTGIKEVFGRTSVRQIEPPSSMRTSRLMRL